MKNKKIDPEKDYFLRQVFNMGIIRNQSGEVATAFSTCREVVNSNLDKFPSLTKIGKYYQIKGADLIKYLDEQTSKGTVA